MKTEILHELEKRIDDYERKAWNGWDSYTHDRYQAAANALKSMVLFVEEFKDETKTP